jgi:hypothetical protein
MPLYSADITALNTLIDRATKTINWLSGNSDEFFTGSSYAITANGAVGYWDSWRTANSSASASSTGDEKIWYDEWKSWDDAGGAIPSADTDEVPTLQAEITKLTAYRDHAQAQIDAGLDGTEYD